MEEKKIEGKKKKRGEKEGKRRKNKNKLGGGGGIKSNHQPSVWKHCRLYIRLVHLYITKVSKILEMIVCKTLTSS